MITVVLPEINFSDPTQFLDVDNSVWRYSLPKKWKHPTSSQRL